MLVEEDPFVPQDDSFFVNYVMGRNKNINQLIRLRWFINKNGPVKTGPFAIS